MRIVPGQVFSIFFLKARQTKNPPRISEEGFTQKNYFLPDHVYVSYIHVFLVKHIGEADFPNIYIFLLQLIGIAAEVGTDAFIFAVPLAGR